eukprot:gene23039-27880_t
MSMFKVAGDNSGWESRGTTIAKRKYQQFHMTGDYEDTSYQEEYDKHYKGAYPKTNSVYEPNLELRRLSAASSSSSSSFPLNPFQRGRVRRALATSTSDNTTHSDMNGDSDGLEGARYRMGLVREYADTDLDLLWFPKSAGDSVFGKAELQDICELENELRANVKYKARCWDDSDLASSEECPRPHSPVTALRLERGMMDAGCEELVGDETVLDAFVERLARCAGLFRSGGLAAMAAAPECMNYLDLPLFVGRNFGEGGSDGAVNDLSRSIFPAYYDTDTDVE